MAKERTVQGVWQGDWRCDVTAGDFTMRIDEPTSVPGGTDTGPQPTDMLLTAISSCFTLALAHAARKRSIEVAGIEVDTTGVYDGPSFSQIRIDARVGCQETELAGLLRAAERVCYVTNTIRGGPELHIAGTSTNDFSDS